MSSTTRSTKENVGPSQLVLAYGRDEARRMVAPEGRPKIDIAAAVLGDEEGGLSITYTGFCLTGLPHRRLPDDAIWERTGHQVRLLIEPGRLQSRGKTTIFGVPYGARARMILFYLQTEATKTKSREVEIGSSMRNWLERMGLSVGGETAKAIREQTNRLSACSMKFFWDNDKVQHWIRGGVINQGITFHDGDRMDQGRLWVDRVVLDEHFYASLMKHPVPLQEQAIRELRDRSMSLDIYIFLAYRLHMLSKDTSVSWKALAGQFGAGFKEWRNFKPTFLNSLSFALAAYPDAKVDIRDAGLVLKPSRSPVPPRNGLTIV